MGHDDHLDNFYPQASSQWDSLRHIRHPREGFYNWTTDDQIVSGGGRLGIENMARRGIAGRGVLLDVERHLAAQGRRLDYTEAEVIDAATLDACAREQGVELRVGDILLVHTGWLKWYLSEASPEQRRRMAEDAMTTLRAPGIGPKEPMARYLWDLHVAAVAADNPSLEPWPPGADRSGFLHFDLIPLLGIPIGELWWLSDLAADCAEDGVYEFFLTSAPLDIPGGVGSPPNALAIK
jgi:kynurenine formamidase